MMDLRLSDPEYTERLASFLESLGQTAVVAGPGEKIAGTKAVRIPVPQPLRGPNLPGAVHDDCFFQVRYPRESLDNVMNQRSHAGQLARSARQSGDVTVPNKPFGYSIAYKSRCPGHKEISRHLQNRRMRCAGRACRDAILLGACRENHSKPRPLRP